MKRGGCEVQFNDFFNIQRYRIITMIVTDSKIKQISTYPPRFLFCCWRSGFCHYFRLVVVVFHISEI